jgi:hypothetical protein
MTLTEALNLAIEKYPFMAAFARPAFAIKTYEDASFNLFPAPASDEDLAVYKSQYPGNEWQYDGTKFKVPNPYWGFWHPSSNLYRYNFWVTRPDVATFSVVQEYLKITDGSSTESKLVVDALAFLFLECYKLPERIHEEIFVSGDESQYTIRRTFDFKHLIQDGEEELLIHRLKPMLLSLGEDYISKEEAEALIEKGASVVRNFTSDGWVRYVKDRSRVDQLDAMKGVITAHLSQFFPNVCVTEIMPVELNYHSDGGFNFTPDALNLPDYNKSTVYDKKSSQFCLIDSKSVDANLHTQIEEPTLYSGKAWRLRFTFADNFDPLVGTSIFFATPDEVCAAYEDKNESIFSDLKEALAGVDLMYVCNANWCERNGYEDKEKNDEINLSSPVRKHLRVWQWCLGPMASKCQSTGRPLPLKMFVVNGFDKRSLDTLKI